jgi:hypothetical protein
LTASFPKEEMVSLTNQIGGMMAKAEMFYGDIPCAFREFPAEYFADTDD